MKFRGWPSASKIEAEILKDFQLNLDHRGEGGNQEGNQDQNHQESESRPSGGEMRGMSKLIKIKTIRNLNLDHLGEMLNLDHMGGIHFPISLNSPPDGLDSAFPPGWSRFRFLMVLILMIFLISLISPPDGLDSAFPPRMV